TVEVVAIPMADDTSSNNDDISNEKNSEHLHTTDNLSANVIQQSNRFKYKHYRFMYFALISFELIIVVYHIFT
ncbi:hypothetical protein, partial [Kiloniella majae]|uniref:hypothetical protein n=1 Tax=Kiloniella majae TaxID=1938558 RepID=UPI001C3FCC64